MCFQPAAKPVSAHLLPACLQPARLLLTFALVGVLLKRAPACFTLLPPQTQLSLQGQVRKKDALIDKLRAQLTRAEAKYRARLDAAHSPGGCCLPCMHASDEIHAC